MFHNPQTPDAPPSPGPPMIPDNFPMYEEWENLTHQGVSFTISYRQQIYEGHSEIITTLIDRFSELNKHTSHRLVLWGTKPMLLGN